MDQPAPKTAPPNSLLYAFDRAIAPVGFERFLAEYYEQRPLVLHREQPGYYADLLSLETLDDFLTAIWPRHNQVFVVDARREIPPAEYTLSDWQIDVVRLHQLFTDGATITFRQMQDRLPALGGLCRAAEQIFNFPFQTNLYFTPAGGQGFKTHHDTHDVFVLQVSGSKRWRVYDPVIPLPLPGQSFQGNEDRLGPATDEFTLHSGDLFYCPRGFPHDAQGTDEPSLHITFGCLVTTWAEVMVEAMADACLTDPAFRTALPLGYAMDGAGSEEMELKFRELVERFSKTGRLAPATDGLAEDFISSRRALIPEQRRQIAALDQVALESWVGVRDGLIYRRRDDGDTISLHCHSSEIAFPRHAAEALTYALQSPRFLVRDLPGGLDDQGKLVLIRRLIREGLITTVD